ncbi:Nucleolar protein 56 [Grifola frondosa]|uniref:Nucleolar protein 56 n=1 Tax=Grifola frondosa TaxID=5627 RepID=A0A1C7LWD6_GRIFR|nr:Nucleolar protein 56 [Grifola frondosa]
MATHALFESASGYAVFEVKLQENVGSMTKAVQESIDDLPKFSKMVSLISFSPFQSAAHALENMNDVSENIINDHLKSLLELNLVKPGKKSAPVKLAVCTTELGAVISQELGISCDVSDLSRDLIRGIRQHAPKLLKGLQADDLTKAQLGLGHAYSRAKLKFNVNRIDNMIIQAIALLDQLDKDVNLFSMRIREWYGYHFPELVRLETLTEERLPEIAAVLDDDATLAQNILDAARNSMGSALSEIDMLNIGAFATRVVSIAEYRKSLAVYLSEKMNDVAPSLTALLGERIVPCEHGADSGSRESAVPRAKDEGNTPKYGLIYHSSFIGRAGPKYKGRISRFLANKCSIASRIDCYSEKPTALFGEALRQQVEERLNFFETGAAPSKNADAIRGVLEKLALDEDEDEDEEMADAEPALPLLEVTPKKKEHKKKRKNVDEEMEVDEAEEESPKKKQKLSKEEKKALKKEKKKKAAAEDGASSKKEKKEKKDKKDKKDKKKSKE